MKRFSIIFVVVFSLVTSTFAQERALDDTELELLNFTNEAIHNLSSLSSYALTGTEEASMVINTDENSVQSSLTTISSAVFERKLVLDAFGNVERLHAIYTSNMTLETQSSEDPPETDDPSLFDDGIPFALGAEQIFVNNQLYARNSGDSLAALNAEWERVDEQVLRQLLEEQSTVSNPLASGAFAFNDVMLGFALNYVLPIEPETVASVSELVGQELDGQMMRVILIEFDAAQMVTSNETVLSEFLGITGDVEVSETLLNQLIENTSIYHRIWIGTEDHLPHLIKLGYTIQFTGDSNAIFGDALGDTTAFFEFQIEATSTIQVGRFNEDFAITAPLQ